LRGDAGSAIVELALFVPVFLLMLAGIVNYGFLIEEEIQVQEAAAAGAAYATIPGNYKDVAGMTAAAQSSSSMLGGAISVSATNVYSCSPGGGSVGSSASCSGGQPLMFAQVTTTYTAMTVLQYAGIPSTFTLRGFASYEVPWAP
jgi:Flp pilus assembly protein TadG